MLLAAESHKQIEAFLRDHFGSSALKLPPVYIYAGRFSRWLTGSFHILAITFGRRIFIAPKIMARDARNRLTVPADLIAHEATHVLQYERAGFIGFLVSYLNEYWRALRSQRQGWGDAARHSAYLAIKQEAEARQAEMAYATWRALQQLPEVDEE
jgi:hypothetical protein